MRTPIPQEPDAEASAAADGTQPDASLDAGDDNVEEVLAEEEIEEDEAGDKEGEELMLVESEPAVKPATPGPRNVATPQKAALPALPAPPSSPHTSLPEHPPMHTASYATLASAPSLCDAMAGLHVQDFRDAKTL